jgi:hypothetical protein
MWRASVQREASIIISASAGLEGAMAPTVFQLRMNSRRNAGADIGLRMLRNIGGSANAFMEAIKANERCLSGVEGSPTQTKP